MSSVVEASAGTIHAVTSLLPVWAILLPLAGSLAVYLAGKKSEKARNATAIAITILTFILVASMYPTVIGAGTPIEYKINILIASGINFRVDGIGLLLALITSFIWMLATIYAISYMKHEHAKNRFYSFLILTLAADLGVLLTGDLFSLFIFFEMLGLSSWVLVIHEEDTASLAAGKKYLFMGIIGGLSLLLGIVTIYAYTGTLMIAPMAGKLEHLGALKYVIATAMTIGFGVKAGMFPLHVWLPDAHPVAPTPASALLSGVMIKAGAYGIIRTINMIFTPSLETVNQLGEHGPAWLTTTNLGYVMIWVGIVTMFFAVCMALQQENSKRMLAYHSVSQMGYILMGIGVAAYMGFEGTMGFGGALYHIVNHALFKALLFMTVGAVYYRTHELNMYKLGGLWRDMPFTFLCMVIASAGIAGVPLFNGYASKTMLHEAIVEAKEVSDVVIPIIHIKSLHLAEIIFTITGGGTAASFMKLTTFTFLGKKDTKRFKKVKPAPIPMKIAMGGLASVILLFGLMPNLLVDKFLIPSTTTFTYSTLFVGRQLGAFNVWTNHALLGIAVSLIIGALTYGYGIRTGIFHVHLPDWFGINYYYYAIANGFVKICGGPFTTIDEAIDKGYKTFGTTMMAVAKPATELDRRIDQGYVKSSETLLKAMGPATELDKRIDQGYMRSSETFLKALGPATEADRRINNVYVKSGEEFIALLGPNASKVDNAIDNLYIKSGTEFLKVTALSQSQRRRVIREHRRFKYLREPVSIFDQSADEFFREVGENIISLIKYPYAAISYPIDVLFGSEEYIESFHERVEVFERESRKLLYGTPNISGISIATAIMVIMLTIYLTTSI